VRQNPIVSRAADRRGAERNRIRQTKKSTGEEWKAPDELSSFIRQMHPEWDEVKKFIEKWIEETIVPKFANGDWPLQLGSCNDSPEWNTYGQERQCVMHVAWRCDAVCCVRARHTS